MSNIFCVDRVSVTIRVFELTPMKSTDVSEAPAEPLSKKEPPLSPIEPLCKEEPLLSPPESLSQQTPPAGLTDDTTADAPLAGGGDMEMDKDDKKSQTYLPNRHAHYFGEYKLFNTTGRAPTGSWLTLLPN